MNCEGPSIDDMRLGRQVENGIRLEFRKQPEITDVGLAKHITRMVLNGPKRHQIGRIGQLIDIQNSDIQLADQQPATAEPINPAPLVTSTFIATASQLAA
jgi:hypothetical protein